MENLQILSSFGFPKLLVNKEKSVYEKVLKELNSTESNIIKLHRIANNKDKETSVLSRILNDNHNNHSGGCRCPTCKQD